MPHESLALNWRRYNERYLLIGSRCETCGQEFFPKKVICPNCRSKGKLAERQMPWEGTVYSYTKVNVAPQGYENYIPYYLAVIELSNKVKVLGQLVDSDEKKVRIGTRVRKVFRKVADVSEEGIISYGYKFKITD